MKIIDIENLKAGLSQNVNLLAVSKGQSVDSIRLLLTHGQVDFGESRLQEALIKIKILEDIQDIRWHFIGRIQSNKVRGIVKVFEILHSVDSFSLAERISRISGEEKRYPDIMLQVKLEEDPSKGGFEVPDLLEKFPQIMDLPNIRIIGLMTILPNGLHSLKRKSLYKKCRNLANQLRLKDCSMGMSRDWQDAVDAGATWVRIGSLLFGDRSK